MEDLIYKSLGEPFLGKVLGNQRVIKLAGKCQWSQMPIAQDRKFAGKKY